jgi:membrane-associated phospholipid phosphatase
MKKCLTILLLFPIISIYSQNIDIDLLKDINLNRNKQFDGVFRSITNSAAPVAYAVPILLLGYGLIKKDSITNQNAIYIGSTIVLSEIISTIIKHSVNRPRPFITYSFIEKVSSGGSPSFPSGHTSDAFALATSVSMAYPKWYVIIPSYAWAGAVGYSRMDLGVHYPSDVLAGAIIGAGSAYLCYKGQQWLHKRRK